MWAEVPTDRLVYLSGAAGSVVRAALSPLPDDAPAVMTYRPAVGQSVTAMQVSLVAELESVAVRLFPSWLPGAEVIDGPGGAGVAAVRILAARAAAASAVFGPFLEDLAERSLSGHPTGARFSVEVRAAGVARTIAASFGREHLALLVDLPQHSGPRQEHALVAALEWFAYKAHAGVWLTGGPLLHSDRVPFVAAPVTRESTPLRAGRRVPADLGGAADTDDPVEAVGSQDGTGDEPGCVESTRIELPAVTGRPHPASRAEERLERALAARPWAHGRAWNHPYRSGPLAGLVFLDLVWLAERLVVEVDGPEHRGIAHYDQDRLRDTELVLDGFTVLRFTNNQILGDVDAVVGKIERCIEARRSIQEEA
jgi:very-short-patch-repair endonuclease